MVKSVTGIITIVLGILFLSVFVMDGYTSELCMECHEEMAEDHAVSVHGSILCLECHGQAEKEDHEQIDFALVDCSQCHAPHGEKILHDAHSRVTCKACHVKGGIPGIDPESGKIIFNGMFRANMELTPHQAIYPRTKEQCKDCHFQGNALGASSMILPAKSVLCMPCHVATFSAGDKTTMVSLFVFSAGMAGLCIVWFFGSIGRGAHGSGRKTGGGAGFKPDILFSKDFFRLLGKVFMEVFFLKRLFQQSRVRWIIHALIFFPFLFRLAFGLTAVLSSMFWPGGFISVAMLDKNYALGAFFFDVTGVMIIAGSLSVIVFKRKELNEKFVSLPEPGSGMTAIIALVVLAGFVLEGLRIAMTGWPVGSGWAFVGYGISLLFKGMTGLTDIYGVFWYVHAILTGTFIALIPFTRMVHIFTAPMVLIVNVIHNPISGYRTIFKKKK